MVFVVLVVGIVIMMVGFLNLETDGNGGSLLENCTILFARKTRICSNNDSNLFLKSLKILFFFC